jgi:predicted  nucleic acid-binding Zn-ribbon protein
MGFGISNALRGVDNSGSAESQINRILTQIKGVRKQLVALQKQLQEVSDPDVRKVMMKQIQDLQRTIEMLQQQIAMIEANELRKQEMRTHAQQVHAAEELARSRKD